MFAFISKKKTAAEIARDKLIVDSLNSMKSLRVSGGAVYVDVVDVKDKFNALHDQLKLAPQRISRR